MLKLYDALVLSRPKAILAILVAAFAFFGFFIKDFQLDASADSLVLENDDDLLYSREIGRRYGGDDFVFVTFRPKGDLFGEHSLNEIRSLRDQLLSIERVESVQSILDVPLLRNPPVPLTEVQSNLKTLEEGADVELAREEFRTSPVYRNLIVSEDLRSTALAATFARDDVHAALVDERQEWIALSAERELTPAERAEYDEVLERYSASKIRVRDAAHEDIATIRAILENYRGDAEVFLGGVPMIVDDIVSFIKKDLMVFGIGMMLLLIATLGVIFHRVRWVALPMVCCALSVSTMMGLLGLVGWEVTVVSSNFISLQLIFTMSLTIHLIVRYRELMRDAPERDNRDLLRDTVAFTFVPCLYASLTTVAGFASLVLCDILPVMTFGWMMTMGIGVSLAVVFLLFPAVMSLLPKPPADHDKVFGRGLTSFFGRATERRGGVILAITAVVAALTAIGASRLEVENSFIDYFKESTEIYQGMEFIDRELGGTTPLDVVLEFGDRPATGDAVAEGARDATAGDTYGLSGDDADLFDDFDDAGGAGDVAASSSDDDLFDEFDDFADGDEFADFADDTAGASTEDAAAAAREEKAKYWFTTTKLDRIGEVHDYLAGLEATGKVSSLATLSKLGRDINQGDPLDNFLLQILFQKMPEEVKTALIDPYVSLEHDQVRINVRIKDSMKSLRRDALLKKIRADLHDDLGLEEDEYRLTGLMVLYNNMLQSLFQSQIKTIGYTVLALTLMFLLLFRSLKISLIAIFPSLLSSLIVIGVMGLGGIPLDVMTITIVAISVGIAVDDTIHYIHRFEVEFEKDRDYVATMHRCHDSIGSAMLYTSLTITTGFSILAISNFIPSILFGLLTALAMMMALVSALTLLPRLIVMLKPFGAEGRSGA